MNDNYLSERRANKENKTESDPNAGEWGKMKSRRGRSGELEEIPASWLVFRRLTR